MLGLDRQRILESLPYVVAAGALLYTVGYPFLVTHYPPLTDLPFHAAQMSILRHYWDPSWHFQEQFTLHPIEVPYISMYALGALFSLVMPVHVATKAMAFVMLALLPIGLGVLFHGMKKTPLLGLLGLGVAWGNLTNWGFLNFMGAIGLYAMAVGFTLLVVDRPTRGRVMGLALTLLAVFFTHIYRFPFALLSVAGATVLMYPATRRFWPVLMAMVPSVLVFAGWRLVRRDDFAPDAEIALNPTRLLEIEQHLFSSYYGRPGAEERAAVDTMFAVAVVLAIVSTVMFLFQGRHRGRTGREWWWGFGVTLLPVILAGGFLVTYLSLPMRIGLWWYVYPREITTTVFIALAAMPDLPRQWWYRLPAVAGIAWAAGKMGFFTAQQWWEFDATTRDFRAVAEQLPRAPKLLYLVFDHNGTSKRNSPYLHLPAWVQAERGGSLSFHFVGWNYSPIRYRPEDPNVPPPVPDRWEWRPQAFRMAQHGAFFDSFLIRHRRDPAYLFRSSKDVQLVAREGIWWLYRRR